MRTLGDLLQSRIWMQMVDNVVKASGGRAGEVRQASETLSESETQLVQRWAEELVIQRRQHEAEV